MDLKLKKLCTNGLVANTITLNSVHLTPDNKVSINVSAGHTYIVAKLSNLHLIVDQKDSKEKC